MAFHWSEETTPVSQYPFSMKLAIAMISLVFTNTQKLLSPVELTRPSLPVLSTTNNGWYGGSFHAHFSTKYLIYKHIALFICFA